MIGTMKKICLLTVIFLVPMADIFALSRKEKDHLIERIAVVESRHKQFAVGDHGKAYGLVQAHSIMVREANRISGKRYTHEQMFDPRKAREVVTIVIDYYDRFIQSEVGRPATAKELAFIWNGGGDAWTRVTRPIHDGKQRRLEAYYRKILAR